MSSPCMNISSSVPEKFYWAIHSIEVAGAFSSMFVLILVHIVAFDDLQTTSAHSAYRS